MRAVDMLLMMMIMNTIISTMFRVAYITLKEPTEVTVHGQVIGTWTPAGTSIPAVIQPLVVSVKEPVVGVTFTPAPKPIRTSRR